MHAVLLVSFSYPLLVLLQFYTLAVPVPPDSPDDPPAENPFGLPSEYAAVLQERCVCSGVLLCSLRRQNGLYFGLALSLCI